MTFNRGCCFFSYFGFFLFGNDTRCASYQETFFHRIWIRNNYFIFLRSINFQNDPLPKIGIYLYVQLGIHIHTCGCYINLLTCTRQGSIYKLHQSAEYPCVCMYVRPSTRAEQRGTEAANTKFGICLLETCSTSLYLNSVWRMPPSSPTS